MDEFYYKGLNREEKSAYEQMLAGFKSLAPTIRITRLEPARLAEVYLRLKLDTPLLFHVTGYSYRFYPGAEHVELLPEYLFDKGKIRTHQQAIAARIERLTRPLRGKSQLEKEIAIHDFILDSVRYDKLKKSYSHEIIGPLTQGVGVCEGIAKTVKALCDAAGVECIIALSEANPEKGVRYRHTWTIWMLPSTTPCSGVPIGMITSTWTISIFSRIMRNWCCRCRNARRTRGIITAPYP